MALINDHYVPVSASTSPQVDRWIRSRGLTETSRAADESGARLLDEIAGAAVGSEPAAKLLRSVRFKLEQSEKGGGVVRLDGNDAENDAASAVARRLVNIGYLSSANVRDGRLHFAVNSLGDGQRRRLMDFLKGSWLEHGVRHVARTALGDPVELVMNLAVTDEARRDYELDLVIGLPDGGLVLVECKAANRISRFLPRFRDVCDAVGVDGPRAVLVGTGVDQEVVTDAQTFHRITIVSPEAFVDHLHSLVPTPAPVLVVVPNVATDEPTHGDADPASPGDATIPLPAPACTTAAIPSLGTDGGRVHSPARLVQPHAVSPVIGGWAIE